MILKKIFRLFASNAVALFITAFLLAGFHIKGDPLITIAIGSLALGIAQYSVNPILKIISIPINMITLGLFNIIINVIVLWIVVFLVQDIAVTSGTLEISLPFVGQLFEPVELPQIGTLFAASISISIINWILKKLVF